VSTPQRFQVIQDIATAKLKENKERRSGPQQTFISTSSSGAACESSFNTDLCHELIKADTSFQKLSSQDFKSFLERYSGKKVPDQSTLYANSC